MSDKNTAPTLPSDTPHVPQPTRVDRLLAAFAAAWHELSTVTKDRENPHLKAKYATLTAVLAEVRPVCQRHGLALLQTPGEIALGPTPILRIVGVLIHAESGQSLTFTTDVPLGADPTPQKMGSATSYGRRYQINAIFGLTAADEDDDGESLEKRREQPKPPSTVKGPERPQGFQKR